MPSGGKRTGAGRRKGTKLITCKQAGSVLDRIDEDSYWRRYLDSDNDKVSLQAMMYLTDRRDGKAPQSIKHEGGENPVKVILIGGKL